MYPTWTTADASRIRHDFGRKAPPDEDREEGQTRQGHLGRRRHQSFRTRLEHQVPGGVEKRGGQDRDQEQRRASIRDRSL